MAPQPPHDVGARLDQDSKATEQRNQNQNQNQQNHSVNTIVIWMQFTLDSLTQT